MDQVLYDRLLAYLRTEKQPEGLTRSQRTSLWWESKNYVVERGQLFYKNKKNKLKVVTESQKKQILESCHSSGPDPLIHYNQDQTLEKVSKYYYWPRCAADVRQFCQSCELCIGDSSTQEKRSEGRQNTTPRRSPTPDVTSRGASPQPEKQDGFLTRSLKYMQALNPWKRNADQNDIESATLESTHVDDAADLCALCSSRDINAVERHLQNSETDVNVTDSTGETPLHKACTSGDLDILKLLLKQDGIKISPKSDNGQTPLHIASRLGNLEAAQLLVDAEHDMDKAKCAINTPDPSGLTPLCYSAKSHPRKDDMVSFLLERGADLSSSLKSAAACTVWKTKDAEVLIKLCGGLTPQNMDHIFEVLKMQAFTSEGGSKYCSITDENENSLLHIAARYGQQEFVRLLIEMSETMINAENGDSKTPLHFAIEAGNVEIVDTLLNHNAKITAVKESQVTPLHMAVKQEAVGFEILSTLLKRQTDASSINSRDINKRTPLHYAAVSCGDRPRVIELLLKSGAELDAEDEDGLTPLMLSAVNKCEAAFDIMVQTEDGARVVKNTLLNLAQAQMQPGSLPTLTVSKLLQDLLAMPKAVGYLSCTDASGNTPLHIAAGSNYVGAVGLLLAEGADCNPKNNKDRTPLHNAALGGNDAIVEALINEDTCDVVSQDKLGMTPLHIAAANNCVAVVKLLTRVMDCNSGNSIGRTALHLAAAKGYSIIVQELVVEGKCDISHEDNEGMTSLHIACQKGHIKVAKVLLANRANIDRQDTRGYTPLTHAVTNYHKEITNLLILNGASFSSAFISVAKHGHGAQMIQACGREEVKKAVFEAVGDREKDKSLEFLKLLIKCAGSRFCNCYCIDRRSGNTPLHVAASFGCVQTVELLLQAEQGQRSYYQHCVEVKNIENKTPIHVAAENGFAEVVVKLISYHKQNGIQLKCGTLTPMHLACHNGHQQVVEKIAKMVLQWVDSSDANNEMRTPLHVASENGYVKVVEILVNHKAKLKAMKDGTTPIHIAVKKGYTEVVRALLSAYRDEVNTADTKGKTPLHLAARYCGNDPNIITELLKSGADVGAQDSTNYTPLMVASAHKNNVLFKEMMDKDNAAVEKSLFNAAYLCDAASLNFIRLILKSTTSGKHQHLCSECKDHDGDTILHIAASTGKTKLIELMLDLDIKWDPLNAKQKSPLHLATENGHHQIVRQLLNRDPKVVNTRDYSGFTPLHCACQNNLLKVVKIFEAQLDLEEVLEAQTQEKNTPLHIACMNGGDKSLDIVNFLIEKNANVHAANKNGETPIHISARRGYEQLTSILLEKGADVDVQDAEGHTPVILAAISDHKPVILLLLPKTNLRISLTSAKVLIQSKDVLSRLLSASSEEMLKKEVLPAVKDDDVDFIQILADHTGTKYLAKPVCDSNTPLHIAASYGYHDMVKTLLGARPDPNQWFWGSKVQVDAENEVHRTPLHLAAENGHLQVVSILLNHQSRFKTGGLTPMHLACRRGHYEVVQKIASLVQVWIDAANRYDDMRTPLHIACEHSYKEVMCILLEHGAKVSFTKEENLSPVHLAVRNGFADGLEILLKERPDGVNCKDKQHRTPLHYAGEHSHNSDIIALLLEREGNMEAVDRKGFTPLLTAAACENYDAFNTMVDKRGDALKIALFQASKYPKEPNIRALKLISSSKVCEFSVCYQSRDEDGNTPLHTSARCGNLQAAEIFLEWQYRNQHEKRLELVQNAEGKTPAHVAAEYNHSNILKVLISMCDHDVSVLRDKSGKTILHLACRNGHLDILLAIEDSLFDSEKLSNIYELCDNEGNTLLHLACQYQKENVVRHLINKRGAKVDARSKNGEAPIHVAAQFQSKSIIDILLEKGADIESKDAHDCTPLHHAARCNKRDMVLHLKRHGAKLNAESVKSITPLIMAAQHECTSTFQCLMRLVDQPTRCVFKMLELPVDHGQILRFMLTDKVCGKTLRQAMDNDQNTLLHVAAVRGNLKAIETLLDLHLPAEVKNDKSKTAMHLAALKGHASVVKEMIAHKPSLAKEVDEKGMTPLHCACQQGYFEVVKVYESLLDEKEVLQAEDNDCNTPLHLSCGSRSPSIHVVNYLIFKGANLNARNKMKLTPLHIATQCGYIVVAEILVKKGAEFNCQDEGQCTPLHYAAQGNFTELVHLLCKEGANLSAEDSNSLTPVLTAVDHKQTETFHCLMEYIDMRSVTENPAFKVLATPNYEILEFLVNDNEWGLKLLQATDHYQNTPLHHASGCGDLQSVEVLLKHDCAVRAENKDGKLSIHLAAEHGYDKIVKELIHYDPNLVMACDNMKLTLLHIASQCGHLEVARVIFNGSGEFEILNAADEKGNTSLHLACEFEKKDIVEFLIASGAKVTAVNSRGEIPLHVASQKKSVQIVELLLDKGDRNTIELMDNHGYTALHHAAENNQTNQINFLHQRGADVYAEDRMLCTPVLIAAAFNKVHAFRCLLSYMDLKNAEKNPIFTSLHVRMYRAEILNFLIMDTEYGNSLCESTDRHNNGVLHITARENDLAAMAVLMEHRVKCDVKNMDGKTPMHLAAEEGHHESVQKLMVYDSTLVTAKDNHEMIPLHLACLNGHMKVVQLHNDHLSKGLCEKQTAEGNTPLHLACTGGNIDIVELLIHNNADKIATNKQNEMPLHIAVHCGHVPIARFLLNLKVPTDCHALEGYTPLHYAARKNTTDTIVLLFENGAPLDAKDNNLFTPTHTAVMHQCLDAYHCLMKHIPDSVQASVIFMAFEVKSNRQILLKSLLDDCKYGEKLCHATDETGHTPLHIASECGDSEAVSVLLEHGARADAQNGNLETPMHLAAGRGLDCVVQQLIAHNPKLMLDKDGGDRTPLHTACLNGRTEVVRICVQNLNTLHEATDVIVLEATDSSGNTPLHLACVGGNVDVVQLLFENGASTIAANSRGEAPIHTASQHKSVEIVKQILDKHDPTIIELMDGRGFTALHHAAENNQTEIIIFLQQCGANVYAEDQSLCTPVLIAAACKNVEAFQCLMQFMDLQDDQKNPIFKALKVKLHRSEILQFLITETVWGATLIKSTDNHKNRVLHITALENDLLAMAVLMEHKVESCIKNAEGKTPMHLAAEIGHHEAVLQLIMYESKSVTSEDNCGMTPLHLACLHGCIEIVQIHEKHLGLRFESLREHRDADGNTPFHLACAGGSVGVVELLIENKVNTMAVNNLNETPLHTAVRYRHEHIAQILLNMKVSTECQTREGQTPLHYAAKENDANMIKLLVNSGAKLYARDNNCCVPTHIAAMHQCVDSYHCLMECIPDSDHSSVIFMSFEVKCSREIILKFLVSDDKCGEKLCNAVNDAEHTPLHIASERGNQETVKILLQYGAYGNAQNSKLETPIHLAAGRGHKHIVKLLIDHDRKLMLCRDERERTSLHTACLHGQTDVVMIHTKSLKLLLEETGMYLLNDTDGMGNSPLHLACVGGSRDSVQLLIDSSASLNQTNIRGEAPIHIAAQRGFVPIAEVLLANGVDIESPSGLHECTPLHHAAKFNQDEMIKFLCGKCANIHAEDDNFCTPVLLAASCGHTCAFDCLMGYLDLEDTQGNPIFQVLKVKSRQEKILKFLINNHSWGLKLRTSTTKHKNNPLHVAANQGNNLAVKVMLDQGFDARAKNVFQRRPLHLAAVEGHPTVVKTFIGHDTSLVMDRDKNGMIPLHLASLCGKLEAVKAHKSQLSLVKVREARDSDLNTPLHLACKSGNREVAEYLIEVGCSRTAKNLNKDSLIHVAVQNGHIGVTELLLDKGVSTESLDAQKCTPVHVAAKHNQCSIIEMLKERDADLFAEDCHSFTPVLTAAVYENTAAFHCLMQYVNMNDSKQNPVFKVVEITSSWEDILNFLFSDDEWGSKLQQSTDMDNNTPLHAAARHGNIVAVKVLLQLSFDTYAKNHDGRLPIHLAAEEGHLKVVLEFIHHNPHLTVAQDANRRIPLHTACRFGHVEVVKIFNLSISEVLHASDSSGNTPLHLACEGSSEDVVQFLIDSGASVSEANNDGEVPTHIAAQNGFVKVVERIWKKCAYTVLCEDKYKRTTLHHAAMAKHNHGDIIPFLVEKCGDTSLYAEDQNSLTPILMAAAHRQVTAFRFLMKYVDLNSSDRNPAFKVLHLKWKQAEILKFMIRDSDWGDKLSAAKDESGNTLLHVAARDGNQEAVSALIKLKVQVNARNNHRKTPIHLAAEHGQNLAVHQLSKHDYKLVEEQDADGRNALHLACLGGHCGVVSALSEHMSEQVREACDSKGNNRPLHLACESNSAIIVNLMILMKADTTAKNNKDEIPLHIAALKGNVQIGRLLVAGAKIKDFRGFNSLHNAAYHNQTKMIAFLCDSDKKSQTLLYDMDNNLCTPVLIAAASENKDAFHCLMEYVDLRDPKKNPIFMAFRAQCKKMAILKFMINDLVWGEILSKATAEDGRTPLHIAAAMGNEEIADLLISKYKELVYAKDVSGKIPLHLACYHGETGIVEVCISKLEDSFTVVCESQDDGGNTPLHYACENDSPTIVKLLIIENDAVKTTHNHQMEASIHIAAKSGFTTTATVLLDSGISTEIEGCQKYTPLHYAAENGHTEIIRIMCDRPRGADLYAEDENSYIPIMVAARCERTEAFDCLMNYMVKLEGAKKNPLFKVLDLKANLVLKFMVENKDWCQMLCETRDNAGNTPLHIAVTHGNSIAVHLLIDHNAQTDAENDDVKTPLHLAAEKGHYGIASDLLHSNPSIILKADNEGKSPLHLACQNGHLAVVHCILESKQGVLEACDKKKNTAMHLACMGGNCDIVELLIEKGAKTNPTNDEKRTPMHTAAKYGFVNIVKTLQILRREPIKCWDYCKRTPLHLAAKYNRVEVIKFLHECHLQSAQAMNTPTDSDLHAVDDFGYTPVVLAAVSGSIKANCQAFQCLMQYIGGDIQDVAKNPLFQALKVGDAALPAVKFMISDDGWSKKLCEVTDFKNTCMHVAAKAGLPDIVEEFLNHEVTRKMLKARNIRNMTALHLACQEGHHEVVKRLEPHLSAEDVTQEDREKNTALHLACEGGMKETVQLLLSKGASIEGLTDVRNVRDEAPIHFAARYGYEDIAGLLLDKGVAIDTRDIHGCTPLHHAARNDQEKMIHFLCMRDQNLITLEDHDSHTPILTAAARSRVKAFQCLMSYQQRLNLKENPVFKALESKENPIAILKLMINDSTWGSKLRRATDGAGNTALHIAAKHDNLAAIKLLLEGDPLSHEMYLVNNSGKTPMHMAAEGGHINVVGELVHYQSDTKELRDQDDNTPLHLACMNGHLEVARMLFVPRLLTQKNEQGNTPLHLSCMRKENIGIVKDLIAAVGSDPGKVYKLLNERNAKNQTPLDLAYQMEDPDTSIILHLIEQGANVGLKPVFEKLPESHGDFNFLDWAIERNHRDVAMKIVESEYWEEALRSCHVEEGHPTEFHLEACPTPDHSLEVSIEGQCDAASPESFPAEDSPPTEVIRIGPPAEVTPTSCPNQDSPVEVIRIGPHAEVTSLASTCPGEVNQDSPPVEVIRIDPHAHVTPTSYQDSPPVEVIQIGPHAHVSPTSCPAEINQDSTPVEVIQIGPSSSCPSEINQDSPPVEVIRIGPHAEVTPSTCPGEINRDIHPNDELHPQNHCVETTPFRKLIAEMPDVAEKVLDRCTERKKYTFEFLEDFKPTPWYHCQRPKRNDVERRPQDEDVHWGPKNFERSNHPLAMMVKHQRSELLKHQLVSTFLRHKFTRFGAAFYLVDLLLYVLFLAFLTSYALTVPTPLDDICNMNATALHPNTTKHLCPDWRTFSSTYLLATFMIMFAVIRLLLQLFELCMLMVRYCSHLRDCKWHYNWKEFLSRSFYGIVRFLLFVFAIAFASVFNSQCPCITNGQWQVGVLAVFLGWINMITFIKLVPRLGVYVLMFLNVIYSFLKMLILGFLLVMAFGLAFYMLFRNPYEMRTPFATPGVALIKTMTMPLANFDFDGMFHLSDDEAEIPFFGVSYLMWIVFVVILAVLFLNLLTSVAVGDIQEVRQNTLLRQRELHVELLLNLEELVPPIVGDANEQQSKTCRIFEWLWEITSGESKAEQVHPLEHKVEQTLSEIECVQSTLREHSRKLEETESLVKQVAGQHEVQENIAQQTSELIKEHLGKGDTEKTDVEIQTDSEMQGGPEEESSFQSEMVQGQKLEQVLGEIHALRTQLANIERHLELVPREIRRKS